MRILLLLTLQLVQSSVIGIDFGQEWFKVSIVKPGIPLDIVLNKETKRKTNSIVALKNNKRLFGNDAIAASIKDPSLAHYPKSLLGSNNSSNHLVGLILQHAKLQAQVYGNDTVTGAVLTVPPYFKQHQRLALLDAADIADLRVISLFNDETAVALNYAMLRQFSNNTQYHIFFDMGAGSTVASLVSFKTIQVQGAKKGSRVRHVPQLTVEAVGYDEDLGGSSVDKEILNLLTRSFIDKQGKDFDSKLFLNDSRAMTRLLREASRVKQVLSANQETYASVYLINLG